MTDLRPAVKVPLAFPHLMIDIETLALHTRNSVMLSVGLVEFNPWAKTADAVVGAKSSLVLNVLEQLMLGRVISKSTVKWWQDQSPDAQKHWLDGQPGCVLDYAVEHIQTMCKDRVGVWANGILFDLGNIEGLVEQVKPGSYAPWHYQAARDMRTFCRETKTTMDDGDIGVAEQFSNLVPHEPISDCINQIDQVWRHWPR